MLVRATTPQQAEEFQNAFPLQMNLDLESKIATFRSPGDQVLFKGPIMDLPSIVECHQMETSHTAIKRCDISQIITLQDHEIQHNVRTAESGITPATKGIRTQLYKYPEYQQRVDGELTEMELFLETMSDGTLLHEFELIEEHYSIEEPAVVKAVQEQEEIREEKDELPDDEPNNDIMARYDSESDSDSSDSDSASEVELKIPRLAAE